MSSITITTSSFGAINSTVTGQAPATITLEIGTPGPQGQQGIQGIQGPQGPVGPAGTSSWGSISGSISSQTDLSNALAGKYSTSNPSGFITSSALSPYLTTSTASSTYAPLASPTFSGTVTIPAGASISGYLTTATAASTYLTTATASSTYAPNANPTLTGTVTIPTPGTSSNTTVAASTAFVKAQGYATLASPTFTGDPKAPTPATSDNDTSVATTAFVKAQGYAALASPTFSGTVTIPAGASISGYLTSSIAASTYQTLSGMSSYPTFTDADGRYLQLSGGALTVNSSITVADSGIGSDSQMGGFGFGVENTSHSQQATLEFGGVSITSSVAGSYGTNVNTATIQGDSANFSYTGYDSTGAFSGATNYNSSGLNLSYTATGVSQLMSLYGSGISSSYSNYGTTTTWSVDATNGIQWNNGSVNGQFGPSGIRFADGSTQTTAYTGGGGGSSPPYSESVWIYGNWYSASINTVYTTSYSYVNVLTF